MWQTRDSNHKFTALKQNPFSLLTWTNQKHGSKVLSQQIQSTKQKYTSHRFCLISTPLKFKENHSNKSIYLQNVMPLGTNWAAKNCTWKCINNLEMISFKSRNITRHKQLGDVINTQDSTVYKSCKFTLYRILVSIKNT